MLAALSATLCRRHSRSWPARRDGLSILREIRQRDDPTPVLVLLPRGSVDDRVGLAAARISGQAVAFEEPVVSLRRSSRVPVGARLVSTRRRRLDAESRQAFIDDQPQVFSAREAAVLELLMRRQGRVVPKRLVEDHLFGLADDVASNAIEVYIHRLRKQLADRGAKVQIHTIRGVGYLIAEEKAG
jgi:DNA-binding response OmpR family regulator